MAILKRRHFGQASKYQSEIALVAKSNFQADFRNRDFRFGQQLLRLFDAKMIEVWHEGLSGEMFKCSTKTRGAHSNLVGSVVWRYMVGIIGIEIFKDGPEAIKFAVPTIRWSKRFVADRKMIENVHQNHFDVGLNRETGAVGGGGELFSD